VARIVLRLSVNLADFEKRSGRSMTNCATRFPSRFLVGLEQLQPWTDSMVLRGVSKIRLEGLAAESESLRKCRARMGAKDN